MEIFPDNPELTDRHRRRIAAVMGNVRLLKTWIREDRPSTADLKRAVFLEIERGVRMRPEAISCLLASIQRNERCSIGRRILKAKAEVIRRNRKKPTT